jgi:hypothetical protein
LPENQEPAKQISPMFESAGFKPAFFRVGPVGRVLREQAHYVAAESTNPLPPYTSWPTAARN